MDLGRLDRPFWSSPVNLLTSQGVVIRISASLGLLILVRQIAVFSVVWCPKVVSERILLKSRCEGPTQ